VKRSGPSTLRLVALREPEIDPLSSTEGVGQPMASRNSESPAWPAGGHLTDDLVVLVRPAHKRRPETAICRYFALPPRATSGPQDAALVS
jgi:hypothetical protein